MSPSAEKRIGEIAESNWFDYGEYGQPSKDDICNAIRAALTDPEIRQEIENDALEDAAVMCEKLNGSSMVLEHGKTAMDMCAAFIRAMKR
jgi:hypothetical protein